MNGATVLGNDLEVVVGGERLGERKTAVAAGSSAAVILGGNWKSLCVLGGPAVSLWCCLHGGYRYLHTFKMPLEKNCGLTLCMGPSPLTHPTPFIQPTGSMRLSIAALEFGPLH